jgi:hypothetical protein
MEEIRPGLYHWTARHPRIGADVSSYWLDGPAIAIDPLVPPREGLEWFASRPTPPRAVLLSNRHHHRQAESFVARFGCTVHCNRSGLHEFGDDDEVAGFEPGDVLPGGVRACAVGAICPDETALHLPEQGALVIADGVVRGGLDSNEGPLGFVPDSLMDDPPGTKAGLLAAYRRLLEELDFEHLLLAHGGPVLGDGREQLRELIETGGRTAFEL